MKHLLAISVGPVQEFIAAARRTRDLWFGSYLLSELSKAVARSVKEACGTLIFPHPETELAAGKEDVNVANIILAELDGDDDPAITANQAKKAGQDCWRQFAYDASEATCAIIRCEVWNAQVDDVMEFYAAWVSFEDDAQYPDARKRVMRLLEGRKNCRDFLPAQGIAGLPKSSLDGQRETVLCSPDKDKNKTDDGYSPKQQAIRRTLRIKQGEQLDVVGLVKRHGVGSKPYPSVSRVAADPWIRGIDDVKREKLRDAIEEVRQSNRETIQRLGDEWKTLFDELPYEGTVVYRSRHHELIEETGLPPEALRPLAVALGQSEPNPYLAVLMADGDRMGKVISSLTSAEEHRTFSLTLSGFATQARQIVREHRGVLIYSGGDDVLAFVPVDKCLDCARKLHDTFGKLLESYQPDGESPTLSVGIAIAHFMEDLEELRQYALDAEKAAKKPDRDGLAVHLHKRSGSPTCIRCRWQDSPDVRLKKYAEWIRADAIPSKLPYDLRKLIDLYRDDNWHDADTRSEALRKDVVRIIKDKQPKGARSRMKEIEEEIEQRVGNADELHQFCEELLVARLVATVMDQASPRKPRPSSRTGMEATT